MGGSGKCRDALSSPEGKGEGGSSNPDKPEGHVDYVQGWLEKSEERNPICEKEIAESKSMTNPI